MFQITNESSDKKKTFLYEFCGEGRLFKEDDTDEIFVSRLQKVKDENKFTYLIHCYRRLDQHLYAKEKIIEASYLAQLKEQIVTYFNTVLQVPETFNISNNSLVVHDSDQPAGMGGMNQQL